ncbi:MAG TPA: family 10 glycosylhydrolase [Puia sp.]|nr:family 10 glycosylhydrolase [Puia sp.]
MALENEINQRKFRNEYQKARLNILYTNNWLSEKISAVFDKWDITPRQFNILRILRGEGKPLSTLQIRQRMLDKMSDTSRIVDRLVRKGMVRKTPSAIDRRLVDVIITSRGRKLLEKIDPLEDEMDKMMSSLSPEEASTLSRLLDKLRNILPVLLCFILPSISIAQRPDTSHKPGPDTSIKPGPGTSIKPGPDSVNNPFASPPPAEASAKTRPKYEFRAVWVASVENIDWPSKKGLPVDSQKAEFIRLLDMHQRNGLNAVVVQIRPAADAFFPSPYEPWSEWLTGIQGQPPSPYYDPLAFMIEETHKRGMEFHAWCNPYRAVHTIGRSSIAPDHITRQHPEWFVRFEKTLYFDPGNKEVQDYVTNVIRDIVRRYDIDALHFDDYFYPYDIVEGGGPGKDFPDDPSYARYGNGLSKADWRRANVDSVIARISKVIKEEKPHCKFGISPFAIWRNMSKDPEGSDTHAGQTDYDNLYADILLWLKNGWIDYVVPQIYFEFSHPHAPYATLVDWWARHTYGRQCYIGLAPFLAGTRPAWRDPTQLTRQIQTLREYPTIQGAVFFSSKSFETNPNGWCDSLQNNYYSYPALIPPMPWIDSTKPHPPQLHIEYDQKEQSATAFLTKGDPRDTLRGFAIYQSDSAAPPIATTPAFRFIPYDPVAEFTILNNAAEAKGPPHFYFATAISRTNVESDPVPILMRP